MRPLKSERRRRQLAIAKALRNAHRPLVLADNPLIGESAVRRLAAERYEGAIMGEERALSDLISECAARVLKRIGDDPRLVAEATVLTTEDGASTQLATAREPG